MEKRESTLRASILDTALELGVGTSSTVANWIFNPVNEEEDTEVRPRSFCRCFVRTSEGEVW